MGKLKLAAGAAATLVGIGGVGGWMARGGTGPGEYVDQLGLGVDTVVAGRAFDRKEFVMERLPAQGSRLIVDHALREMRRRAGEKPDLRDASPANQAITACGLAAVNGVSISGNPSAKWGAARNLERASGDEGQVDALYAEAATLCTSAVYAAVTGGLKEITYPVAINEG